VNIWQWQKCLPITSNFNSACQNNNPYCSIKTNENDCDNSNDYCMWNCEKGRCIDKKENPYPYKNTPISEMGFKKLLIENDGNCSNGYAKAICSPNYYSGIEKVKNSTDCMEMNNSDFEKACSNIDSNNLKIIMNLKIH